jgi:DNA-binding transcriptional ArsR family regulator
MTPDELDVLFKALADPTRRRIVDRLAERPDQSLFELCVAAVAEGQAAMSRQAVSQHLDVLEQAGLVRVTWSGRTKLHRLDLAPLRAAKAAWLGRLLDSQSGERTRE